MNELDKLREMLTKAGIPYEDKIEPVDKITNELMTKHPESVEYYGEARKWRRNQVIYGRTGHNKWKWDGIWQYGSYGAADGMIESYGELGVDEQHNPKVVTAEEAFAVIKADYEGNKEVEE